jgi:hypothetical protein
VIFREIYRSLDFFGSFCIKTKSIEKTIQNFENPTKIRRREEKKLQIVKSNDFTKDGTELRSGNPSKIRHYNKKGED